MDPHTVTRVELNTQLESRVAYMKSFLEWTDDDCEIMKAVKPIAKPLVPEIVASAYNKLLSYECCKLAFCPRKDGCQGTHGTTDDLVHGVDRITIDSASIKIRRNILEKWAMKIFTSDYRGMEIFEFFNRIGIQHVGGARVFSAGAKKPLFVDYIHLAMTLGYITDRMTAAILSLPSSTWSIEKKTRAVRAFHKISWIHNDLLARHHTQEAFVGNQTAPSPLCTPAAGQAPERRGSHTNLFSPGLACPMTDEGSESDPPTPGYHQTAEVSYNRSPCNGPASDAVSSQGSSQKKASDSSLPSVAGLHLGSNHDTGCPFDQLNPAPPMGERSRANSKAATPPKPTVKRTILGFRTSSKLFSHS